ncbi:5-oxoprolinase subunit B family protein [Nocardioides sp.]|uniref:5-oxoprolinase subunit B family protein n=1 Tax=Nocardioides sp. TaxID=35761 RepID=UPI003D09CE1C
MHLIPVGRDAVLVEVADAAQAVSLATWARDRVTAIEIVPAARTVLFDGVEDDLEVALKGWHPGLAVIGANVSLEVEWDGADLDFVSELWGRPAPEVLLATEFTVAFCGFAPGFSYLTGLPETLAVPRLDSPRSRVPAGSLALAGDFAGIYPSASPGGWRLVGTVDAPLWDPARTSPALLPPGTRVRLR